MARKASADSESSRGFNDIIGVVLMCFAALLLAALLSYHPRDVPANSLPPNASVHNWIGPFGAWLAYYWFLWVGAAAYLLPGAVLCGWSGLFLRRLRLPATPLGLGTCTRGLLHGAAGLYTRTYFRKLHDNLNAEAGGILGLNLNQHFFGECFGTAGATIIFLMLYFISLLFLTNFQLGEWIRSVFGRRAPAQGEPARMRKRSNGVRATCKSRPRSFRKKADRSGLGADMKPVPAPTVRDLSVSAAQQIRARQEAGPARAGQGACARG